MLCEYEFIYLWCALFVSFLKERNGKGIASADGKFAVLSGSGQLYGKWNGNSGSGTFRK